MRHKRLYIVTQRYPDAWGVRRLSFAVYYGREFCCYSWSLTGAWIALNFLREGMKK